MLHSLENVYFSSTFVLLALGDCNLRRFDYSVPKPIADRV